MKTVKIGNVRKQMAERVYRELINVCEEQRVYFKLGEFILSSGTDISSGLKNKLGWTHGFWTNLYPGTNHVWNRPGIEMIGSRIEIGPKT